MFKKWMAYAIGILIVLFFTAVMLGTPYLKRPLSGPEDDVLAHINRVEQALMREDWKAAADGLEQLQRAWRRVVPRIQFSVDREDINNLDVNLARLRGAILAEDANSALIELTEARSHWDSLGT